MAPRKPSDLPPLMVRLRSAARQRAIVYARKDNLPHAPFGSATFGRISVIHYLYDTPKYRWEHDGEIVSQAELVVRFDEGNPWK